MRRFFLPKTFRRETRLLLPQENPRDIVDMMKTAYLVFGLLVAFAWQSSAHYGRKNKLRKTYKLESADLPERDTTKRNWEQFKRRLHPVRLSRPEYYEDNDLFAGQFSIETFSKCCILKNIGNTHTAFFMPKF